MKEKSEGWKSCRQAQLCLGGFKTTPTGDREGAAPWESETRLPDPLPPAALAAAWGDALGWGGVGGKIRSHGVPSWSALLSSLSSGPIPLSSLAKGPLPVSSEPPGVGFYRWDEPQRPEVSSLCNLGSATAPLWSPSVKWVTLRLQGRYETLDSETGFPQVGWTLDKE